MITVLCLVLWLINSALLVRTCERMWQLEVHGLVDNLHGIKFGILRVLISAHPGISVKDLHFECYKLRQKDFCFCTLVYWIDVQYEINVQVGKFLNNIKRAGKNRRAGRKIYLKNIKRAGQNRRTGGNFFSKSINVQTKIRPCRGVFFLKIFSLALKKALILHFNDSMMVS